MEGDAVFALGADRALASPEVLFDALDAAFVAFKNRQRILQADDSCSCNTCRSVGNLDLKIARWPGRRHPRAPGRGRRAYIPLTEAALRWAGVDPDLAGLDVHTERCEHFGDVRCFVRGLDAGVAAATVA